MERGPLPPHERTWRHPSELAAEERAIALAERSTRSTRVLALMSGALGVLAVGALIVTVTPRPSDSPIAISASTTPTAALDRPAASPTATEVRGIRSDSTADDVLATPIGDGTFAVVTRASLRGNTSSIVDVRLPSGRMSASSIVTASDDAVVVALASVEAGHPIAKHRPGDDDIVTVMADPPVDVPYEEVGSLAVDEGTAVIDDTGHLVGICSRTSSSKGVRLIEVSSELDDATSVVP